MTSSTDRFHVAGVLVQALPAQAASVRERIERVEGAVIHAADESGRLVVTLESLDSSAISHQLTALQSLRGVLSAVLVSEHSEPLESGNAGDQQ
jgi:periplasmic nitrate reductase NapD